MSYPFLIQGKNIVVIIDDVINTINDSHLNYVKVLDAIKSKKWSSVKKLFDVKKDVHLYSNGNVTFDGDAILWKGEPFDRSLSSRMIKMYQEGYSIDSMVKFVNNLMSNPSKNSIKELYGFMSACDLPITEDGCFLAYKRVGKDYKDCHSGKFDNSIGKIVKMTRSDVDANQNSTCSRGLHFCSLSYLQSFPGDHLMVVKINPKNVVSIPTDYNNAKGRCCEYEVISELIKSPEKAFNKAVQNDSNEAVGKAVPAQEYDKNGNPLSMTPNAIRKRLARANKAANKVLSS